MGASAGALFNFLNIYGAVLAPLAAIFVVDYWLIKKQRLDVKALYIGEGSRYWYSNGFNVNAFIAWIAGTILPTLYSIVALSNPGSGFVTNGFMSFINNNAYIFAFLVAFIIYAAIGKSGAAAQKAIVTEEEEKALTA
jgi:NCS1 family nucleobase:cation symporter-1